jgi:hypothetical protein
MVPLGIGGSGDRVVRPWAGLGGSRRERELTSRFSPSLKCLRSHSAGQIIP